MALSSRDAQKSALLMFGAPAFVSGKAEEPFVAERPYQLLAYLACRRQWVARDKLVALLCPDVGQTSARRNLRQIAFRAGKLPWLAALESRADALRWQIDTDLLAFEAALAQSDWSTAVAVYRGPFLDGLERKAVEPFVQWLRFERERLTSLYRDAMSRRLTELAADPSARADLANRWLALEPLDEDALIAFVQAEYERGLHPEGRRACCAFVERLAQELGVEPSVRVRALLQPQAQRAPTAAKPRNVDVDFVGRRAELQELRALLARDECRVLTITGPGGIGKSRLARVAFNALTAEFADGAAWIGLGELTDVAHVAAHLAAALGITLIGADDTLSELITQLGNRRVLLIVDNSEHLAGLGVLLARLVAECPAIKVLNTSRARLSIPLEWLLPLDGLPVPEETETEFDALRAFDSIKLFELRARAVLPSFDLAASIADVAALMRAVDGIPLAIELAAAWVRVLPPSEITGEIAASIDVLAQTGGGGRQASVRASFDHSWRLLAPAEQRALARLSAFPASFSRASAAQIADTPLAVLGTLVEKSLLRADGAGRFSFHALMQQCAQERLDDDAEVRRRHAESYAQLLARHAGAHVDQKAELAEIGIELENCRAAWTWAVATRANTLLEMMTTPLAGFFEATGRWSEGVGLMTEALHVLDEHEPSQRGTVAGVLQALALLRRRSDPVAAERMARRALELYRGAGMASGMAKSLHVIGVALLQRGEIARAQRCFGQGLRYAEVEGETEVKPTLLNWLAVCAVSRGDYARAAGLFQQALSEFRRIGSMWGEVCVLINIGELLLRQGDLASARGYFLRELRACDDCGFANFRAFCLLNLGVIDFKLADLKSAGAHLERALEQARSASGPVMLAAILQNLGRVAVRCGDLETARGHLCEGLLLASAAGAAGQELNGVAYFAELLARTGDRVRAATYLEFVVTHPATEAAIRDEARESLATLAPTPAESAIAETEARRLELGTLVDTLIKWSAPLNDAHSPGARAVRPHQVA